MMIHSLALPPSDAEVDAWLAVLTSAAAVDLPQLPPPSRVEVAGRLCVTPARGRPVLWTAGAGEGAGESGGVAALLLFTEKGNTHTAFLDALTVRPEARRRGVGTALWERVRAELLADGRTSVAAMLDLGGPGQAFAEALGFENVLPMAWYVQDVPADGAPPAGAPADGPAQPPATPGYELLTWYGLVPDAWAPAAAAAHAAMEDAPTGDMDERIQTWTPERLHTLQQLILDRGGDMITVAAVTPGGEVAAYTEIVLPDPWGTAALQYDTVVVPAHRGHGLGRAVKRHMAAQAAARHPQLRRIATTVADENAPMRAVNEALGYRRERGVGIYQIKL
ncbi:GNAT family N-acetyltransferase [Streptomyces sp. A0592]|uniref:GNAT family N-acetyltransferase n=1 Tax=Streptomyces sp. A0592 TaxID=2563099 RepID=UPI00109E63EE|nr:GNAT family N-acetyltransferase [Streptomyces sp. A0592]THA84871.1 GNAT family N-acetyltransferase [Streptomyces sp. A0592]